eukprot:GHVU01211905.1.p1 GENE.GHVU01211905.1~~GHVU01211905.1.p1  ORF type:complete len:261 (+),score=30.30 GHVU01211905.1:430-1212(+)
MDSVKKILALCAQTNLTDVDIELMTNFTKTPENEDTTAQRKQLVQQVKNHLDFDLWKRNHSSRLKDGGFDADGAASSFLAKFGDLYRGDTHFRNGLLVGLVKAVIARASGVCNARVREDAIAFCQVLHARSASAYALVKNNLFGISERHIRRLQQQERGACVLDEGSIKERVDTWGAKIAEVKGRRIFVSLSLDATKVPMREEVSAAFDIVVGGISPSSMLPIDMERRPMKSSELASEIKCALLATQDVVQGCGWRPNSN